MYPYIYIILPSYGVMAFVGGCAALIFLYFRLSRYDILFTTLLKCFIASLIGGFVGGKVLFAVTQIPWLIRNFSFVNLLLLIPESGLVYYGGLFGVIFAIWICTRKDAGLQGRFFRMAAPAFPLFHGFGRIGCFMAGCCYGKDLAAPVSVLGVEFTQIPVQLMESAFEFLLFFFLLGLSAKKHSARLMRVYLIAYAVFRFWIEFWRGDEIRGAFLGLSTSQWISLGILAYYLIRQILVKRGGGKETAETPETDKKEEENLHG